MKPSRKRLFDLDDLDTTYSTFREEPDVPRSGASGALPRRSVTISDFARHYSVVDDHDQEPEFSEEEWDQYGQGEEEDWDEAGDSEQILKCFKELEKKWTWNREFDGEVADALRNCDYDVQIFVDIEKQQKKWLEPKRRPAPAQKPAQKPAPAKPPPPERAPSMTKSQSLAPLRQHIDCRRTVADVTNELSRSKKYLNLVVIGHVDAGKSTLMGHLMKMNGKVSHGQMTKLQQQSKVMGKEEDCLAWIMAEDDAEREHGITIDVAMVELETDKYQVMVLDAPGHRDYVPNMIAGASQADAALLVVDAGNPLIEGGQAMEHMLLCRSLGVSSLIVVVNKMDSVGFKESVFQDVKEKLAVVVKRLAWPHVSYVPAAANLGENLMAKSKAMPWYNDCSVVEAINKLTPPTHDVASPFVLCVSETAEKRESQVVAGRIESGYVCKGDWVRLIPGNNTVKVSDVKINGKPVQYATAGRIADLTIQYPGEILVGSAVVAPDFSLTFGTQFKALIHIFHSNGKILMKGASLIFHRHAVDVSMRLVEIEGVGKRNSKAEFKKQVFIGVNHSANVIFRLESPLPLATKEVSSSFGRFIIRQDGATLGFGTITQVIEPEAPAAKAETS